MPPTNLELSPHMRLCVDSGLREVMPALSVCSRVELNGRGRHTERGSMRRRGRARSTMNNSPAGAYFLAQEIQSVIT